MIAKKLIRYKRVGLPHSFFLLQNMKYVVRIAIVVIRFTEKSCCFFVETYFNSDLLVLLQAYITNIQDSSNKFR